MSKRVVLPTVLVISALTLQLEFLQTRIFSVILWYHFVYIVITMALLGFAASGTALSVSPKLRAMDDASFYCFCLLGFSLSSYLATKAISLPIWNLFTLTPNGKTLFVLVMAYTVSMVPYFFAGLAVAGSFIRFPKITGILYFANLIGSALGCLLFVLLIRYMGAPQLLLLGSFLCIIPLLFLIQNKKRIQFVVLPLLIFLVICLFLPEISSFKRFFPESHKQFWTLFGEKTKWEFSEWNPISRIDIISNSAFPRDKRILMDGDAQAQLFDSEGIKSFMGDRSFLRDRMAAYILLNKAPERTLVIGAGGGFDVWQAKLSGSRHIDAVEINPTTGYIISSLYANHIDNLFSQPGVDLFIEDGRSFVARTEKKYDIIAMHATDSLVALSTGAYVLCDNYLYTKEAFEDYLGHLSDDGILQIGRWFFIQKPRETLRVFSTALEACRSLGYRDPLAHIMVLIPNVTWGDVIIKKKPFTEEEKKRLGQFCINAGIRVLFPADFAYAEKAPEAGGPFVALAERFAKGREAQFYKDYYYNVSPASDDRPFFYQFDKWENVRPNRNFQTPYYDQIRGVWHIFILSSLIIHSIVLSFLFVVLPLVVSRKRLGKSRIYLFTFFYFFFIGLAFMFFEMGIVQKFVLFLGSPIYSMAVVIPTILLGAGLGSLCSHGLKTRLKLYVFIIALACSFLIFGMTYFLPGLSKLFFSYPLFFRIGVVIAAILPVTFFMGFLFPLALRLISAESDYSVPWAWAINGSSSVIASVLAILIAMGFGFKLVLNGSAFFYLVAMLSLLFLGRKVVQE